MRQASITENNWLGLLRCFEHVHGSAHTSPHGSPTGSIKTMPRCQVGNCLVLTAMMEPELQDVGRNLTL